MAKVDVRRVECPVCGSQEKLADVTVREGELIARAVCLGCATTYEIRFALDEEIGLVLETP